MAKRPKIKALPASNASTLPPPERNPNGTWMKGFSGRAGVDLGRARRDLNFATIGAMREAFDEGGREAIYKVMKTQPAIFLKLLVLLVPRELEITTTGGVKAMTDEQIEQAITVIEEMLAKRAGERAVTVIDGEASASPALPQPAADATPPDGSKA